MPEDKLNEARKLRAKVRAAKAAEAAKATSDIKVTRLPREMGRIGETPMDPAKVKYDPSNPKPAIKPEVRYKQPLTPSPEGGRTSTPMQDKVKTERSRRLVNRAQAAEKGWKPSQLTEGDPKYQGRRLTPKSKVVTPKGFHEMGIKLEKAATSAPKPAAPKGPGLLSTAFSKVKDTVKTGIASNKATMSAARETAKGARWFNVAAKSAPMRAGLGIASRAASLLAAPLAVAEFGRLGYETGDSLVKAKFAATDFDLHAKAARRRGIKTTRSTGPLAYLSGDPDIKVRVPNPPAAMKEAVKSIPKNVKGRKSFK